MTVQPDDIEPDPPEPRAPADYRYDPNFTYPQRVPFSELNFIDIWGRADPADPQPEHFEIIGPSGSGKTHLLETCLQQRMIRRKSGGVFIVTKKADKVVGKMGWPIVHDADHIRGQRNVIFWPKTARMGNARRDFHERKIGELLHRLWREDANTIVAFDEVGYVESLSGEMRAIVQQYWREARSLGITVVAMKQRPQGALRDMHSESFWTAAFPPADRGDLERWAELFGHRRDWMPVFDDLDPDKHEFVLRHSRSRIAFISWVDIPLRPVRPPRKGLEGMLRGRAA